MSVVTKATIEVIAQTIGVNNLSPDVLPSLAADVEYRVREIMQEAVKCMRHSKRRTLTSNDVESALHLRNVEPIYGFVSGDPLIFKRASKQTDLFYIEEKDVEFREVIEAPLPKAPLDAGIVTHWLAIEGVEPTIPENVSIEGLGMQCDNRKSDYKEDGVSIDTKLPVKHVLSRELQLYFEKITELTASRSDSILFTEALLSLARDSGLHPLVPYFIYFIADEVARNLNNLRLLFALMRLVWSLLQNSNLHIEPYLHQLLPPVITCLVAKNLGSKLSKNHWELRNFAAKLVASVCKRFGHVYHNLRPRVARTLLHTFLDPAKSLTQHYGAIRGIAALGLNMVHLLILPNLKPYLQLIEPEMSEMKRHEASRVYEALLCAAGLCMHKQLKTYPNLLSLRGCPVWKSNKKVVTTNPNKRKRGHDSTLQQPQHKRADPSTGLVLANSLPGIHGAAGGYSTSLGRSDGLSRPLMSEKIPGTGGGMREKAGGPGQTSVAVSARAWNKETDAGSLFASLYECFGESIVIFVPSPELSIFI